MIHRWNNSIKCFQSWPILTYCTFNFLYFVIVDFFNAGRSWIYLSHFSCSLLMCTIKHHWIKKENTEIMEEINIHWVMRLFIYGWFWQLQPSTSSCTCASAVCVHTVWASDCGSLVFCCKITRCAPSRGGDFFFSFLLLKHIDISMPWSIFTPHAVIRHLGPALSLSFVHVCLLVHKHSGLYVVSRFCPLHCWWPFEFLAQRRALPYSQ